MGGKGSTEGAVLQEERRWQGILLRKGAPLLYSAVCSWQIKAASQNKQKKPSPAFLSFPTLDIKQTEPTELRPPSAAASTQEKIKKQNNFSLEVLLKIKYLKRC